MKILIIDNRENRLDRIIPVLDLIVQTHGVKREGNYYIIPAIQFQVDNDAYINLFFSMLAQHCFGKFESVMFKL